MVPSPHARFASPNFMNAFHKCHPFCFWVPFLSRLTEFLIIPQNPEEMILHSFNNYLSTANVPGNLARYWEDGMNETHFLPSWTFHPLWSIPWLAKKAISVLPWDSVMSVSFPPLREEAQALVFLSLCTAWHKGWLSVDSGSLPSSRVHFPL